MTNVPATHQDMAQELINLYAKWSNGDNTTRTPAEWEMAVAYNNNADWIKQGRQGQQQRPGQTKTSGLAIKIEPGKNAALNKRARGNKSLQWGKKQWHWQLATWSGGVINQTMWLFSVHSDLLCTWTYRWKGSINTRGYLTTVQCSYKGRVDSTYWQATMALTKWSSATYKGCMGKMKNGYTAAKSMMTSANSCHGSAAIDNGDRQMHKWWRGEQ